MRISPLRPESISRDQAGLTMFELVVVMAILSVVLLLAVPRLTARIETAELIEKAERIAARVERTPLRARFEGRRLTFNPDMAADGAGVVRFDLDSEWTLGFEGALTVTEMGICAPGRITVRAPSGRQREVRVEAPFCDASVVGGPGEAA